MINTRLFSVLCCLGLSLPAAAEETELSYTYRDVAIEQASGEYGSHDQSVAIMFAGAQMGFIGAGSFAQTANASLLKFWAEENSQKVILATDANGYYTLNVNSGTLSATSTKKLTRGFHRFTMLVRRGVKGGDTQIAQVLVHVDGEEVFNLGDGTKAFASGPFRLATFGGTSGNLISGAMWESAASCGNAESDAEIIAQLDADAAAKYSPAAQPLPSDSYKLVWSDEFEGETVDWTKWSKVPPVTSGNAAEWRKYTSERDDLVSVENGVLTLRGIANDGADPSETRAFLCGQLWSKGKAAFTRGIFEIRAKFENQQGAWPALWMLPEKNTWPLTGEIDFVERLNSDDFVHQTVHHGPVVNGSSTSDTSHDNYIDPTGWNTYRVEWTSTEIIWYVNGVKTFTYAPVVKSENKWPFTTPFHLILSQQLEGNWVGQVDPATLPVNMYVDYVRVYQDQAEAAEEETVTIKGGREDLAFTALQTQSSFYRGKDEFQPLIGLKAEELKFNTFWRLSVELPEDVDPSIITDVKLYKTTTPYFAFSQATEYWNGLAKTREGRKIKLSFQDSGKFPQVDAGDYLWVCVRIAATAPANAKIDAKFTEVVVNGYFAWVMNADPKGYATIYPWAFHIVPYWRLNNWTLNALTADHFAAYTDIIAFYITIDANGNVGHGYNGEQFTDAKFKAAIDKMKKLRGNRDVRILAGVGHCPGQLAAATTDPVKCKRAAQGLAAFVEKFGLDGVDIDWEYPDSKVNWEGWRNLVTELKPLLFALPGGGKQVSIAVTGDRTRKGINNLNAETALIGLYQQCDFVNMMSYDENNAAGHATLTLMQNDFEAAVNIMHLPAYKVCGGQAFYTDTYPFGGAQNGYSWVVNNYPQYIDLIDVFTANGTTYTYNSIKTIKDKCADALNRGGGVMIWANETDVALTHEKSATRAMASVIRPTRTVAGEGIADDDWTRFTTTTTASPTWVSSEDGDWEEGVYTVRFSPLKFTVSGGADTVTMNLIAALPKGQSGALAGWKINDHTVQLVYDAVANRFDVTYDGSSTLIGATNLPTVNYDPLDVTKAHVYTITVSAGTNGKGTYVYQDGNLIVNAQGIKWGSQRLNLNYTFGGAVDGSQVFYGLKIYAADLNYKAASNNQDRILPTSVMVNGRALSTEEKRSAAKLFGPLVEELDFVIAAFDPETGTIELKHNAPFVNGSVSVLGASALTGPWTRVATVYQPTEKIIQIDKERMLGSNFFKVVVEEGRQTLGPVEIAQLADLPSKDFPAIVVNHASGEQYRIPALVTGKGLIIAAYDMRPYAGDLGTPSTSESYSPIDIAGNYSTDGGETWTAPQILVDVQNCYDFTRGVKNNSRGWVSRLSDLGDVCMVYDETAETFFMMGITGGGLSARKEDKLDSWDTALYTRGNGVNDSWEEWTGGPADHPRSVRDELIACLSAKGVNTAFTGNQAILAGPGHGLQTKISNPGRLVIPMQYFGPDGTRVFAAYSDNHGASWQVTNLVPAGQNSQENCIVELDDGSWYMIAKNGAGDWSTQGRHLYRTTDFENWTYLGLFTPSSKVQGSILKLGNRKSDGKGVYAMAFCTSLGSDIGSTRNKLYLYFGVDNHEDAAEPILWDKENYIPLVEGATGSKGYNSMIMIGESTLGVLYEANGHIYFRRIDISDLLI